MREFPAFYYYLAYSCILFNFSALNVSTPVLDNEADFSYILSYLVTCILVNV